MSDLFENIELQMQEDAKEKNPRSAILASQMETEKRFGKFIDENTDRISIIEKEIKSVTDKYAHQYEVDPVMVYAATVSYLTKTTVQEVEEEQETGILPGLKESLSIMKENGFNDLAEKWEDRLSSMSPEDQIDIYPEVVDSFVEAVESSPHTEMWEMDPNQYEDWDKTSSVHKDLSDEELLNQIKEEVSKLTNVEKPLSEKLESLHQELWDRAGQGEKWRSRNKKEEKESKTSSNYAAYQIKGNDHYLCPHCAQEMTGENLNWEDSLAGISNSEMRDIAKYTGHSNKCDQCGMDLSEQQKQSAFYDDWDVSGLEEQFPVDAENLPYGDDYESARIREAIRRNMPVLGRIQDLAMESGHERLANDVRPMKLYWIGDKEGIGALNQYTADMARKLWEVLKGDKRPEQRAFYQQNKDELVDLMTKANALAFESDPTRISRREAAIAMFVGIEDAFIQKEAMDLYGGLWDNIKYNIQNPADETKMFGGGLKYDIPEKTWHDFLQRSNLYGNKPYPSLEEAGNNRGISMGQGMPNPAMEGIDDEMPTVELSDVQPNRQPAPYTQGVVNPSSDDLLDLERVRQQQEEQERKRRDFRNQERWLQPGRRKSLPTPGAMAATGEIRSPLEVKLVDIYMNKGLSERYASIIVESVGEMAQLHKKAPGFPIADSEPDTVNPDKEIGGKEGEKYKNWDVSDKQKALDAEHQDFTDFGETVREFVQPGGEAPYSENTKKKIDEGAESVDMNKKKVKQEDNAPN